MLTNNFKPLLSWYHNQTFKNVNGDSVSKNRFLPACSYDSEGTHTYGFVNAFDYGTTAASNNCTAEQGLYSWRGIIDDGGQDADYDDEYYNYDYRNGFTIFVGNGNTAPDVNDYCLESPLELSVLSAACYNTANEVMTVRTFRNDTGSEVTIKEIGLYMFGASGWSGNEGNNSHCHYPILLGRRVLSTPVTLAAGDMYTFHYTVSFETPVFQEIN